MRVPHPRSNHKGGQLQFGPDGLLYAAFGDGGGGGDPDENAQNLGRILGKLVRIDPRPGGGYAIPAGNPFRGARARAREIYAYGLRNPYRFSFDRRTGALTIGDVGQDAVEEIDYLPGPRRRPRAARRATTSAGTCSRAAAATRAARRRGHVPPVIAHSQDAAASARSSAAT